MTYRSNGPAQRRAVFSLFDQIMSSASNGLIVLAVARVTSVDAFGAATILFAFAAAAMSIGRGALGTPIMLAANRGHDDLRREAGFATTTAFTFGAFVSFAAWVSSLLLGIPEIGAAFALTIPLIIVLDICRYVLISASRPHVALAWDALAAGGSALLFAVTLLRPYAIDAAAMIVLWGVFTISSAVGMASNFRILFRLRGLKDWWIKTYGPRTRYGLEAGLGQIKVIIIASIATAIIGPSAAASLRGAATLLSPLAVLLSALPLAVIPEAVRSETSSTVLWSRLRKIALGGFLLVITTGPALALLPDRYGELILGESWSHARTVLPIVALEYAAVVWSSIAMSFLRYQAKSTQLLLATLLFTLVSITLCAAMAVITGTAVGVAWGGVAAAVIMATVISIYARPAAS